MPGKNAAHKKMRTFSVDRGLDAKLVKEAKRRQISVSLLMAQLLQESLEEADGVQKMFLDPDVRKLFLTAFKQPGSMKKILQVIGESDQSEENMQQSLHEILGPIK